MHSVPPSNYHSVPAAPLHTQMGQALRLHMQIVKDKKTGQTENRHMAQTNKLALFYTWSASFIPFSVYSYIASSPTPSTAHCAISLHSSKILHMPPHLWLSDPHPYHFLRPFFKVPLQFLVSPTVIVINFIGFLSFYPLLVFRSAFLQFFFKLSSPSHSILFQQGPHQVIPLK